MDPVFDAIQQNLNSALSIPFVSSAVTLGLAFYAYKAGPELPSFVEELFLNVFFQVFVGFMVLYMTTGNFMLSLVVSAVFIYGMKMLSGLKEGMEEEENVIKCDNNLKKAIKDYPYTKIHWGSIQKTFRTPDNFKTLKKCVSDEGKTLVDDDGNPLETFPGK